MVENCLPGVVSIVSHSLTGLVDSIVIGEPAVMLPVVRSGLKGTPMRSAGLVVLVMDIAIDMPFPILPIIEDEALRRLEDDDPPVSSFIPPVIDLSLDGILRSIDTTPFPIEDKNPQNDSFLCICQREGHGRS